MSTTLRLDRAVEPRLGRTAFANITPNWFASVMGTGIVATAAVSLPVAFPGRREWAAAIWLLALAVLVMVVIATMAHWRWFPATARAHYRDAVLGHFYGAGPMALLVVGAGALLAGRDLIGLRAALDVDWILWFAGTALGLVTAAAVPYLTFTQTITPAGSAFGGWLMPVVPPMVSAATGALLVPYAPAGQARLCLLVGCYAMFGLSLIASLIVITLIWARLATHGVGPDRLVPTLWIVLGPIGQSITAANLLGGVAHDALPHPYDTALAAFGVVYGVPAWGFALLWLVLAAAITVRTARVHLPFSLTWWSFTFPVGTVVTGTSALASRTGADLFHYGAAIGYAGLVLIWAIVAGRTARGVARGTLLAAPVQG
jgi:C4-dicarboxylate transporter/malic acid transport protein